VNLNAQNSTDAVQPYVDYERQVTARHLEIGCLLVIVLMPAGVVLDHFVYPAQIWYFLKLRLVCAALAGAEWIVVRTKVWPNAGRPLGLVVALLPVFFICWMIYATEGPDSPYYAGLNLTLLAIAFVMRWSVDLSLIGWLLVLAMYLSACLLRGPVPKDQVGVFVNNLYFLVLTGIIVTVGSHLHRILRVREFTLRYELDKSRSALEQSNQKLKELDEVKSRFFANISHELRTPLTLLLAPLETLVHRYKNSFDADTMNLLVTMHSNGMRLLKLINDLLDLVRLESGVMQVKREPIDVADFLKGLASAARQMAEDKRIRLETHADTELGTVMADRDKLEKIILNLQFNALKFTPSGGSVELCAEKQGEELVLIVKDTGMGISAKNLPNIFSRFWQADDSSRRKYQGVGIGLALVKEFAELQGGKASVASEEGKGTTFTVRLPYIKAEAGVVADPTQAAATTPAIASEPAAESTQQGGTVSSQEWLSNLYRRAELFPAITSVHESVKPVETGRNGKNNPLLLVADDEPDMLRFIKSQLSVHYRVLEAVDGQQAIEKARQFLPDIILLDMMMPEKDGLQACREIRARTSTQSIPIVLLTARADEATKLAALEAGASDFLAKPFSTTELHVRIRNLVESHQYQIKLAKQNSVLEHTIEQLKETETQLVQTEKLASLGRMSAGIIHEINNPLNFATTGLFTLRNKAKYLSPEQQEEYQEILKDVEEGIKRVKNIVSDLRSFSHPDNEGLDQVEVTEAVTSARRFLSGEWKERVQIEQDIQEHQTVWANKNKLIQVLVNLLQNSLDAMKGKNFVDEKPTIRIEGRVENGLSVLRVRDNGTGIDSQHLDKIFDPFYTTKDVGEGMGLGLSICYRIVQECDGRIEVKTEAGKFCEFILEFPAKGKEYKTVEA
jgi:signal transduction histidine kinase